MLLSTYGNGRATREQNEQPELEPFDKQNCIQEDQISTDSNVLPATVLGRIKLRTTFEGTSR
jgi:hypothetical protein